jgi:Flp pilus assembly protein TadG
MVESALAMLVFAIVLAGIMDLGLTGFVSNSVLFAAQRAARYASVRGSGSGHAAAVSDIQAIAQEYAAPLAASALTVQVTWTPDNNPGSTVKVQVSFSFKPALVPLSAGPLTLQGTASQVITQ